MTFGGGFSQLSKVHECESYIEMKDLLEVLSNRSTCVIKEATEHEVTGV
mgnify:CR=1 FL=1